MPENGLKITKPFARLIDALANESPFEKNDSQKISVSSTVSKVAFFYEKIRNVVDYREEHLLRKNAIARILRRQVIVEQKTEGGEIAKTLLYELIRARYLPNNAIPEDKIAEIGKSIDRMLAVEKRINTGGKVSRRRVRWLRGILASEIDERLALSRGEEALAHCMYELMHDRITLIGGAPLPEDEKNTQIYLSIHRNLLKHDVDLLSFVLLKLYFPDWMEDQSLASAEHLMEHFATYEKAVDQQLNHPYRDRFGRLLKKYAVLFLIFKEFADENNGRVEDILADTKKFEASIIKICEKKYHEIRTKLRRAATRTIIYIFITKMAVALALEVPFDFFFLGALNYTSLGVNILFHPLLMFVVVMSVRPPSEKNTALIVGNLKRLIYKGEDKTEYTIRVPAKRNAFSDTFFRLFYGFTFLLTFGLLIWGLHRLGFNPLSIFLFVMFLSIVSFFGMRIRKSASELVVTKKKEGFLSAIGDFFFVPIIRAGRWISFNFSRVNVFVFVLDFIIEAPLKILLDISEQWFAYVKEKKEEIE